MRLCTKHSGCHPLVGGSCVFKTKGHHLVMVISKGSDKSCFFLVIYGQWYLMISLKGVQEAHPRHRERIFWADFIQIHEVYIDLSLFALLLYYYNIGQPLKIKNFLDSPCSFKFHHLIFDGISMLFRRALRRLFLWSNGWVNI